MQQSIDPPRRTDTLESLLSYARDLLLERRSRRLPVVVVSGWPDARWNDGYSREWCYSRHRHDRRRQPRNNNHCRSHRCRYSDRDLCEGRILWIDCRNQRRRTRSVRPIRCNEHQRQDDTELCTASARKFSLAFSPYSQLTCIGLACSLLNRTNGYTLDVPPVPIRKWCPSGVNRLHNTRSSTWVDQARRWVCVDRSNVRTKEKRLIDRELINGSDKLTVDNVIARTTENGISFLIIGINIQGQNIVPFTGYQLRVDFTWTGMNVVRLSSDDSQQISIGHTDQMIIVDFIAENIIVGESIPAIDGIGVEI